MPTAIFQAGQTIHDRLSDQMMFLTQMTALWEIFVTLKSNLRILLPRIRDVFPGITTKLTLPAMCGDGITWRGRKPTASAHPQFQNSGNLRAAGASAAIKDNQRAIEALCYTTC